MFKKIKTNPSMLSYNTVGTPGAYGPPSILTNNGAKII